MGKVTIHIGVTKLSYTHFFPSHKKYFLNTLWEPPTLIFVCISPSKIFVWWKEM